MRCIADWYEDYATDGQRTALREDGRIDTAGSAPAGSAAEAAMLECLKLAVEIPATRQPLVGSQKFGT